MHVHVLTNKNNDLQEKTRDQSHVCGYERTGWTWWHSGSAIHQNTHSEHIKTGWGVHCCASCLIVLTLQIFEIIIHSDFPSALCQCCFQSQGLISNCSLHFTARVGYLLQHQILLIWNQKLLYQELGYDNNWRDALDIKYFTHESVEETIILLATATK